MMIKIIPAWLAAKFDSHGISYDVIFDSKKLSSILTAEDVFLLKLANGFYHEKAPIKSYPMGALAYDLAQKDQGWQWEFGYSVEEDVMYSSINRLVPLAQYGMIFGKNNSPYFKSECRGTPCGNVLVVLREDEPTKSGRPETHGIVKTLLEDLSKFTGNNYIYELNVFKKVAFL